MKSQVQVAASPILFAIDALGDFLMRFIAALLWEIVSWDITWWLGSDVPKRYDAINNRIFSKLTNPYF